MLLMLSSFIFPYEIINVIALRLVLSWVFLGFCAFVGKLHDISI